MLAQPNNKRCLPKENERRPMKILLADDEPFYRHWCQSILEEWGYEVVSATDGEEAWQHLQRVDGPRLAILDWVMPGVDGIELCRRIRTTPELKSTYVILVSVREEKKDTITGLENGADDYLIKPIDLEELHARVRAGERIVSLQEQLLDNVTELEVALTGTQKLEALGRLAGGVAHDFNNLLMVISSATSLLDSHVDSEPMARELLHMLEEASDRGTSLTRQLLAFSRNQMVVPRVLDLNELLKNLEKLLSRLIGEDVIFTMELDPELPYVKADPSQFEQVIMNLAVNARDAMPEGGHLTISTQNVQGSGSLRSDPSSCSDSGVGLIVKDTGCGMDQETLQHVFEPFFTTKLPGQGTGLGLATVYGIVKQSGGSIRVLSAKGQGTTFQLFFPSTEDSLPVTGKTSTKTIPLGNGETILVAEDDDAVRAMIRNVLYVKRYNVLEACNGKEALELARVHDKTIDLLLTDTVMPYLSGPDLADQLLQECPGLKVLYVSGYTEDVILRGRILRSDVPFLTKPFSPDALACKVREVLKQ